MQSFGSKSPFAGFAGTTHSHFRNYGTPPDLAVDSIKGRQSKFSPDTESPKHERRDAIVEALDAASLADFRSALVMGRLIVCGNCRWFAFGAELAGDGMCSHFGVDTAPFVPLTCSHSPFGRHHPFQMLGRSGLIRAAYRA